MRDLREPSPSDELGSVDYCTCPLWLPCTCGTEAPIVNCGEDANPWLVDRQAEARRQLARVASRT